MWSYLLLVVNRIIQFGFLFLELWLDVALGWRHRVLRTKDALLALHGHGLKQYRKENEEK